MPWLTTNRKNKRLAREIVFSNKLPKKSVLLLPGFQCECAKYAIKQGIITEDTVCTFVEREQETICQIQKWVKNEWYFPIPPIIHQGELASLEMYPIDLAYIDLFGNLTRSEMRWLQLQLIPNLMPGADLAFTFSVPVRGNGFIKNTLAVLSTKYKGLFQEKQGKFNNINTQAVQIAALYDILFERMFINHEYESEFWTYKDHGPFTMLLIVFKNINKKLKLLREKYERNESISATTV